MRLPRPFFNSQAYVAIIGMDYVSQHHPSLHPSLHPSSGPLHRAFSSRFHTPHPTTTILNIFSLYLSVDHRVLQFGL